MNKKNANLIRQRKRCLWCNPNCVRIWFRS